jgi:hypothetical protein
VGLCRRIDHQPRRVRPESEFRVSADGAVSSDELVDRYEVEKIKTIGDCYIARRPGISWTMWLSPPLVPVPSGD